MARCCEFGSVVLLFGRGVACFGWLGGAGCYEFCSGTLGLILVGLAGKAIGGNNYV